MANDNYISVAMGLDVTDLKAGLNEANKQIQEANSQFKKATGGMDDWRKSTEGINAKITQLTSVLDLQRKKLAGLQAEYDKTVASQGENSESARKLRIQMNNLEGVIGATDKELKNYKETLDKASKGEIDLEKVTLKAGKAVEKSGKQAEEAEGGFSVLKGTVATFAGNVLTSLTSKLVEAGKAILGLADSTREYRRILATLETASEDVGVSADFVKDKFADLMGVFNDEDSITEGLNNLLTAGFDEKSLDSITTAIEGASLKWKDTLKFEGISDSLQEWIGSGGANLTGNFAELLERLGYNLEDVQAKTKGMTDEQRRNYAVNLLNSEGLNEVSESYRENNKDMIEAQKANVNYQNAVAEMGAKIEPITTKIREGFTKILEKILELINGVDMEALGASIASAFDKFVNDILPKIVDGIKWIIDNKDTLIAGIVAVGTAFLTWKVVGLITSIITAIKAWTVATEGLTVAQRILNLVMKANPIGIIITAITALVAVIVYCWKNVDGFKEFWVNAWDKMVSGFKTAIKWISDGFSSLIDWFKELGSKIGKAISNAVNTVVNWGKDMVKAGKKAGQDLVDGIVQKVSSIKDKMLEVGTNIVKGIWNGIKNGAKWLKDKITGFAGDVAGWFKKTFKIKSPSRLIEDEVGVYVGQAVVPSTPSALAKVKKNLNNFTGFVSDNLGGIKAGLSDSGNRLSYSGNASNNASNVSNTVSADMHVYYNGTLSRKELKKLENNHYNSIKTRLVNEGVI